jgi:hypothetical protein
MRRQMLAMSVAGMALACGSSTNVSMGTAVFSGAITYPSIPVTANAQYQSPLTPGQAEFWAIGVSAVNPSALTAADPFFFASTIEVPGTSPQTGTFTLENASSSNSSISVFVSADLTNTWRQQSNPSQGTPLVGTFELSITSVGPSSSSATPGETDWNTPHGTLILTEEPYPGTPGGNVSVNVTF